VLEREKSDRTTHTCAFGSNEMDTKHLGTVKAKLRLASDRIEGDQQVGQAMPRVKSDLESVSSSFRRTIRPMRALLVSTLRLRETLLLARLVPFDLGQAFPPCRQEKKFEELRALFVLFEPIEYFAASTLRLA